MKAVKLSVDLLTHCSHVCPSLLAINFISLTYIVSAKENQVIREFIATICKHAPHSILKTK